MGRLTRPQKTVAQVKKKFFRFLINRKPELSAIARADTIKREKMGPARNQLTMARHLNLGGGSVAQWANVPPFDLHAQTS